MADITDAIHRAAELTARYVDAVRTGRRRFGEGWAIGGWFGAPATR